MQRLLSGTGSPTIATLEIVASVLDLEIEVRPKVRLIKNKLEDD